MTFTLFAQSSSANARTSQPANMPRPPSGVIAPNHLKLVSAKTYRDPLKTITPPRIKLIGSSRHRPPSAQHQQHHRVHEMIEHSGLPDLRRS